MSILNQVSKKQHVNCNINVLLIQVPSWLRTVLSRSNSLNSKHILKRAKASNRPVSKSFVETVVLSSAAADECRPSRLYAILMFSQLDHLLRKQSISGSDVYVPVVVQVVSVQHLKQHQTTWHALEKPKLLVLCLYCCPVRT